MSLAPHKVEIQAMVSLLEADWETPEELAKALIVALDKARAQRTTYVAVMQFGPSSGGGVFYHALGPYAGVTSARNAVSRFPGASVAHRIVIVPLTNDEGLDQRLREVG